MRKNMTGNEKIAVIGLGYVGLPLAVEFGKHFETVGFDINKPRIEELENGKDSTLEVEPELLVQADKLTYTSDVEGIKNCNIFIVTVPTPIDDYNSPDLRPLQAASKAVGSILKKDDIVIYESTVFPGATEEVCIPVLEQESGLKFNIDFDLLLQGVIINIKNQDLLFSEQSACLKCNISYEEPSPRLFSFNSSHGACPACRGLGEIGDTEEERQLCSQCQGSRSASLAPRAGDRCGNRKRLVRSRVSLGVRIA